MEGKPFNWISLLKQPGFEAASVSLMKHVPGSELWSRVTPGMNLEVRHSYTNVDGFSVPNFWIASIVTIQGYFILVRYDGMGDDSSQDFWIHLGRDTVQAIGTSSSPKMIVPPANQLQKKVVTSLTGANALPMDVFTSLKTPTSIVSKFKIGDILEVIDKYKLSQFRVASVKKIVGRRMEFCYMDEECDGFFGHENSPVIHPRGWATSVGHKIILPPTMNEAVCTPDDTPQGRRLDHPNSVQNVLVRVGTMLEAIDPLSPEKICGASVCKVLKSGYIMVRIESYEKGTSDEEDDGFCCHISSPNIFPCGFCRTNGLNLIPPAGCDANSFNWDKYLKTTGKVALPLRKLPELNHGFRVGMTVEMADLMTPMRMYVGKISQIVGRLLRINFVGWDSEFDQWMDAESSDIYPVGWCTLVGHLLVAPSKSKSIIKKATKSGKRRKTKNSSQAPQKKRTSISSSSLPQEPA